ncbi:hypothetical protein [Streptomyces cinereospinus]|uniref:Uncharacterized protein n=1 Tax=Streptomyces cinereospinus TaxID=285561 RepID=A0ABV5MU35_9ACTN
MLTDGFVPDEGYERAARCLGAARLAHPIVLITAINGWNRPTVSRRVPVGSEQW